MARNSNFTPEIRTAMGDSKLGRINTTPPRKENPADVARDKARGIKEGSAQDEELDAQPQNQVRQPHPMPGVVNATLPTAGHVPDAPHVAAAASIAHAILARRPMGS